MISVRGLGWKYSKTSKIRNKYNYATTKLAKKVVHEIKFGDIAVMKIKTICGVVTGILILIGSLRCLK